MRPPHRDRAASRRMVLAILLMVVAFTGSGCDLFRTGAKSTPTPLQTVIPSPALPTAPPSTPATPIATNVGSVIERLLFGESGIYGIVLMDKDGTAIYSRNCSTPFVAASLYKLVLLANIYQMREAGALSFDDAVTLQPEYFPGEGEPADSYFDWSMAGGTDTIDDLVFATGAYSSNVAARALLDLTSPEALNTTAQDLGLTNTYLFVDPATLADWPPTPSGNSRAGDTDRAMRFAGQAAVDGPINITTPCDMARYFFLLEHGQIVSPQASTELLDILAQQAVDDRFPVLLPAGTRMAHKTGNLDHVIHDVGIIYRDDHPTILVAMSEGMDDDDRSTEIIQQLALIAYRGPDAGPMPSPDATPMNAAFQSG